MNTFIIATHSTYAEGLYNCIKFFKADIDNVHYINAYVEDMEFEKVFVKKIEELNADNLIVLTDMPGGSVNQACMKYMTCYNFQLISGVNFPLALELVFQMDDITPEQIDLLIEQSKTQIMHMNTLIVNTDDDSDDL